MVVAEVVCRRRALRRRIGRAVVDVFGMVNGKEEGWLCLYLVGGSVDGYNVEERDSSTVVVKHSNTKRVCGKDLTLS
jgi:hypothetical protein